MTPIAGRFASALEDITLSLAPPTDEQLRTALERTNPTKEMHQAWATVVTEKLRTRGDARCVTPIRFKPGSSARSRGRRSAARSWSTTRSGSAASW